MLGFTINDVYGAIIVFAYVIIVFYVAEKLWKGDRAVGRKILHMSMGNIVFLLWVLDTWVAPLLIAGAFVIFSLLITHRMQLYFLMSLSHGGRKSLFQKIYRKIITKLSMVSASDAGNEWGLFYYCLMYMILAGIFFQQWIFVAVGILPLAYGDGMGAVIGRKYGAHKYRIIDQKSVEGSLAVLGATAIAVFIGMIFYGMAPVSAAWKSLVIGLTVTIVEAIAPRGLDNLAIPVSAVLIFYLLQLSQW